MFLGMVRDARGHWYNWFVAILVVVLVVGAGALRHFLPRTVVEEKTKVVLASASEFTPAIGQEYLLEDFQVIRAKSSETLKASRAILLDMVVPVQDEPYVVSYVRVAYEDLKTIVPIDTGPSTVTFVRNLDGKVEARIRAQTVEPLVEPPAVVYAQLCSFVSTPAQNR